MLVSVQSRTPSAFGRSWRTQGPKEGRLRRETLGFPLFVHLWGPRTAGLFQPSQSTTALPMTSSRSRPLSHGISSVNIVTHCLYEHGMRVMSVPQKQRSGPNVSMIWRRYLWMFLYGYGSLE